jgi:hypothetical protein
VPLALAPGSVAIAARHAAFAGALGIAAALLLPAVSVGAAALVVQGGAQRVLEAATALGGAPGRKRESAPPPTSPGTLLGALPGFAAMIVFVAVLLVEPWLLDAAASPAPVVLAAIAALGVAAGAAARRNSAVMAQVLRDVSALDRQRLATLEIKPPTPIERAIGRLIGEAALPYHKDARLMRRRFPMAFALGALVFIVVIVVGLARPDDAMPWLTAAIAGAAIYGLVLARRLRRPPIELVRLSAALPLGERLRRRARLAWLLGWWLTFTGAPAVFAALRQSDPASGLLLAGSATLLLIVAGASPR